MAERKEPPPDVLDPDRRYSARVLTERGAFVIALDRQAAPVTVNNFVTLAREGYYVGLTFHRVVPGFVAQGGDPTGTGSGGPAYKLPDETNPCEWGRGSVGMASSTAGVSGSQFFVVKADAPHLARSGVYNHFGSVSEGMEVVETIREGDRMSSIEIEEA
ncbi:MAG: peptidylprolyl isomerase [Candidatus Dormibacterales bacterium]